MAPYPRRIQSLDILERLLFEAHMPTLQYLRLDGSVPANRRNEVAQEFNSDPAIRVLLLSTKVGSLGLNLCGQFVPDRSCCVVLIYSHALETRSC